MLKKIAAILVILSLSACSTQKVNQAQSQSNPGDSFKTAIVFPDVKSEAIGVPMEYDWLKKNYPKCHVKTQSLIHQGSRSYDAMEIVTADGTTKTIYFDITAFFGKF